ncbi:MAG: PAS domain S-box protein [Chloroflexi bacterium]|nr:PAS domain S-box protein [Chloroflexota bacterium]
MSSQSRNKLIASIPLRVVLVVPFVAQIVLAVGLVGYLSFRNGRQAVNNVAHQLRSEITARIEEHLDTFLNTPHQITQINATALRQGLLNVDDAHRMEHHFWEQIQVFDSVTSTYFGYTAGGLVGAGREGAGGSLYTTVTDRLATSTWNKYATDSEGNRTDVLTTIPDFDARTRPWYTDALEKGGATWSDVYILFTGHDLAIAASRPVYDEGQNLLGVASIDIFISHLRDFIKSLKIGETGSSFIIERSGLLVASSTDENPFTDPEGDQAQRRLYAWESQVPAIRQAAEFLSAQFGDFDNISAEQYLEFEIAGQRQFLHVSPIQDEYGIDWLIVVIVPEADFMAQIDANNRTTAFLSVAALVIAIIVGIITARRVTDPILRLNVSTQALAKGEWEQMTTVNWIGELGELTQSFNSMAKQLKQTLDDLTCEITERKQMEVALRESEERHRMLFETMVQGVVYQSAQGEITLANPAAESILGLTLDQMQGRTSIDPRWRAIHEDGSDFHGNTHPAMVALRTGKEVQDVVMGIFHPQRQDFVWININAVPQSRTEEKETYQVYTTFENITERKQMEKALRESESRFRSVVQNMPILVNAYDFDDNFIFWNHACEQVTGYTSDEIVNNPNVVEILYPDNTYRQQIMEEWGNRGNNFVDWEMRLTCKGGSVKTISWSNISESFPVPGWKTWAIGVDTTERVRAEESLRESEEKFRSLAENSQDYIMRYDEKCRHVYENPAALRVSGFSEEDIIGKTHREAGFDAELSNLWEEKIIRVFKTGEPAQSIFDWESDQGKVYLDWRLFPEFDASGNVKTVLGVSRDITEIKQAEEQIKASLHEKEALLRELYHRTKNNMVVISSMLALQANHIQDEFTLHILREMENRIKTMALVHQKLYQAQNLSSIDLREYITDLAHLAFDSYKIVPKQIALVLDLEDIPILIDTAIPCGLILNELLSNALKYAFPGDRKGEICIQVRRVKESMIVLQVSDNGVGIPQDFDFRQSDTLGIQTVLGLAEHQLGGEVTIDTISGVTWHIRFRDDLYSPRV